MSNDPAFVFLYSVGEFHKFCRRQGIPENEIPFVSLEILEGYLPMLDDPQAENWGNPSSIIIAYMREALQQGL